MSEDKGKLPNIDIELTTREVDGTNTRWKLRGAKGEYGVIKQTYRDHKDKKTGEVVTDWFDNAPPHNYFCSLDGAMEFILNKQLCQHEAKSIRELISATESVRELWIDTLAGHE